MAQRTGALGLLGLALAVAVISGCGGGSSSSSSTAASASATAGTKGSSVGNSANSNGPTETKEGPSSQGSGSKKGQAGIGHSKSANPSQKAGKAEKDSGESEQSGRGKPGAEAERPEPEPKNVPVVSMTLFSPEISSGAGSGQLPTKFTCAGKNVWPALTWNEPPSGTQELVLFAMNIQPVEGKLFYDWAVAGIPPSQEEISSGELPSGAVLGETSYGGMKYSICPKEGTEESFIFQLFAVPEKLGAQKGFDPSVLRTKALELAPNAGLLSVYSG